MKNLKNRNDAWKKNMVRQWESIVLAYQQISKTPTFKRVVKLLWMILKIYLRICIKRAIEFFLDNF